MNLGLLVIVDGAVWAGWSAVVGLRAARLPRRALDHDTWLTRARRWERKGRWYEHLRIRSWKDRLPEAGGWFGGRSKRHLDGSSRSEDVLRTFAAETRRAELVHWAILVAAPLFILWNPPALFAAMVGYALVANLPCIAIQRYNRARIRRVLDRRRAAVPA